MRPLYKRRGDLTRKINSYFKTQTAWTPRAFRVYLGLSKQMVMKYKHEKPDYYEKIKTGEDKIMATLEQAAIYNNELTKGQVTSIIFTLRAYDANQYVPELREKTLSIEKEEAIINLDFKQPKKKGTR